VERDTGCGGQQGREDVLGAGGEGCHGGEKDLGAVMMIYAARESLERGFEDQLLGCEGAGFIK
jgi:hypothetical protein